MCTILLQSLYTFIWHIKSQQNLKHKKDFFLVLISFTSQSFAVPYCYAWICAPFDRFFFEIKKQWYYLSKKKNMQHTNFGLVTERKSQLCSYIIFPLIIWIWLCSKKIINIFYSFILIFFIHFVVDHSFYIRIFLKANCKISATIRMIFIYIKM